MQSLTDGLLIYGEIFAHFLIYVLGNPSSYMTLQLLHSEFPDILYEENIIFFLSVWKRPGSYHWKKQCRCRGRACCQPAESASGRCWRRRGQSGPRPSLSRLPGYRVKMWHRPPWSWKQPPFFTSRSPAATTVQFGMALSLLAMKHRVHRGRDEVG